VRTLPTVVISLLLFPAIASAQSAEPPPPAPDDAQGVNTARPPDPAPDVQPPMPPAVSPSRARSSDEDQVGILQQGSGDGVGILQGSGDGAYAQQLAPVAPPPSSGQWVYTSQCGWVWMPYGQEYVDEATYGAETPYQYVYTVRLGWSWVAAPWLWGWGAYPYFGVMGPSHFGWYRGLYRSGYGWGRYRGGYARGGYVRGGRYPAGGYARGGAGYQQTHPIGGGSMNRAGAASSGAGRAQGAGRVYSAAPMRPRSFPGGTRAVASSARGASRPRAGGGFHGGGRGRR
jgi:hypothetical protein